MVKGEEKMRKLDTVQTQEKLNDVYAVDQEGPGGAHHKYAVVKTRETFDINVDAKVRMADIMFQKGPRNAEGSQHGVIDSDLLEIVRDRLTAFQNGPFASEYNAQALEHIELALYWMNKRVEDRIARNVLGTYEK